ncbi:MOSC domain-containing protein [Mesobacillus maritimus]|uniref:MOSC domain-containing protein n=1 Tax=Mesobacillus maritimus TaxID=1643336 RepID=A0ABS7K3B4_9BACI|nr:MOSC domain-containing protein [Mesobacillus maritimus]MBY0096752.1 MOSC domain-containing protein [Mesobacillus maritimus]
MPREYYWKDQQESSAIGKNKVSEVYLSKAGFEHDGVANTKFHGGPDRAVCLYPFEHYSLWEKEFMQRLEYPGFGENITTTGMKEDKVFIGDVFALGEAVIEVTQGRVPCSTISKHNGIDRLLKRIVETGYTGYFFRVLEEGRITSDAEIKFLHRVQNKYSVLKGNQLLFHDKGNKVEIEEMLQLEALSTEWKDRFKKLLCTV